MEEKRNDTLMFLRLLLYISDSLSELLEIILVARILLL